MLMPLAFLENLLSIWDNCEHFLLVQMFEHRSKNLFFFNQVILKIILKTRDTGHIEIVRISEPSAWPWW